ncbi:hypothetical protein NQ317_009102 [Molorchus minor]|uniref:Beta-glucuronidase n=1 Tax=Molorchus minor TaxID=1323400 RepID=A0ABQ9J9B2_9CUCU|nr:hypothetical protein NQ317_009102 [Molorchus minor]
MGIAPLLFVSLLATLIDLNDCGILYPKNSITRQVLSLDGLWDFSLPKVNQSGCNTEEECFEDSEANDEDVKLMSVPSSYNDVSTNAKIRDHVGVVRYHRKFFVPKSWKGKKIWLRFGSVCYAARVYINGNFKTSHNIGHLPFQVEVGDILSFYGHNDITVIVNNTLTTTTIPQGEVETLDRPVVLYTTEETYIDDITVTTQLGGNGSALVNYGITVEGNDIFTQQVSVLDKDGVQIASDNYTLNGTFEIKNAKLWWPYLMSDQPGYMYTLRVSIYGNDDTLLDHYEQPFGVRELTWDNTTLKINGKPIYLRGFGRHEDSDIRGKGLDLPLIIRDYNLIRWIGANSYRTSHYPYAEEIMDLADRLGIMIINECPAVNTEDFSDGLLENHKQSLTELVRRDKNRPSTIIWSAANEPRTKVNTSEQYYREVIAHLKSLDNTRPVTVVNSVNATDDHSGQFLDILSFNKYCAWYDDDGDLDVIIPQLTKQAEAWHTRHNKPVLLTEYGADTLEGLHFVPTYIWSEEFQTDLMSRHFQAFDELRAKEWFIGEMIWNFADFKTAQTYTRVGGNKKGVFTRQRQPKSSAHLLRRRYWSLASLLENAKVPSDLDNYVIVKKTNAKDEL